MNLLLYFLCPAQQEGGERGSERSFGRCLVSSQGHPTTQVLAVATTIATVMLQRATRHNLPR